MGGRLRALRQDDKTELPAPTPNFLSSPEFFFSSAELAPIHCTFCVITVAARYTFSRSHELTDHKEATTALLK